MNGEIKIEKTAKEDGQKPKVGWVKMKPEEMGKIVVELAKEGHSPAKIGLMLRDKYGVPKARVLGKRLTHILKEKKIKFKTEKEGLEEKMAILKEHILKNKHDYPAGRSLTKKLWTHNKLARIV